MSRRFSRLPRRRRTLASSGSSSAGCSEIRSRPLPRLLLRRQRRPARLTATRVAIEASVVGIVGTGAIATDVVQGVVIAIADTDTAAMAHVAKRAATAV